MNSEDTAMNEPTTNWDDQLKVHPAAEIFPLMEGAEFDELVGDIKEHGLRNTIVLYQDQILDGRNRYRAAKAAGIELASWQFRNLPAPKDDAFLRAYVISENLHRRHLTTEQRKAIAAELLKEHPERSNRAIAAETKLDDKTVAAIRRDSEASAEIPHIEPTERIDADGRKRARKTANEAAKAETADEQVETLKQRKVRKSAPKAAGQSVEQIPVEPESTASASADEVRIARFGAGTDHDQHVKWLTSLDAYPLTIAAQNLNAVLKARGLPYDPAYYCDGEGQCPHADGKCDYDIALEAEKPKAFAAKVAWFKTWYAGMTIDEQKQIEAAMADAEAITPTPIPVEETAEAAD